jgi:hypothetical protein
MMTRSVSAKYECSGLAEVGLARLGQACQGMGRLEPGLDVNGTADGGY